MNFLAHIYLSGNNEDVMVGNLLGDFLKGKERKIFSNDIQKGILLHREIDKFTDSHPIVEESKKRLRPIFSHYSPVVSDIYYDHFLAANFNLYSEINLPKYARDCYRVMSKNKKILPYTLRRLIAIMQIENLLVKYGTIAGIDMVFKRMANRTKFKSNLGLAGKELLLNYELYEREFLAFFPELVEFSRIELERLSK